MERESIEGDIDMSCHFFHPSPSPSILPLPPPLYSSLILFFFFLIDQPYKCNFNLLNFKIVVINLALFIERAINRNKAIFRFWSENSICVQKTYLDLIYIIITKMRYTIVVCVLHDVHPLQRLVKLFLRVLRCLRALRSLRVLRVLRALRCRRACVDCAREGVEMRR